MKLETQDDILKAITNIEISQLLRDAIAGIRVITESDIRCIANSITFTSYEVEEGEEPVPVFDKLTQVLSQLLPTKAAARIGDVEYETVVAALDAAVDGDIIYILRDAEGDGLPVDGTGRTLTIDFGGYTYTVSNNPAGSKRTKNQCMQILKGNTVTLRNGRLAAAAEMPEGQSPIKMMIQNYGNLTIAEDMTIDCANSTQYGVSCNFGNSTIDGRIEGGNLPESAFDIYYWPTHKSGVYAAGARATLSEKCQVIGKISYGVDTKWVPAEGDTEVLQNKLVLHLGQRPTPEKPETLVVYDVPESINKTGFYWDSAMGTTVAPSGWEWDYKHVAPERGAFLVRAGYSTENAED